MWNLWVAHACATCRSQDATLLAMSRHALKKTARVVRTVFERVTELFA
jgi:Fe-S cluster biogenesis protein NfuA